MRTGLKAVLAFSVFLLLFTPAINAKLPGTYTDYVYASDYQAPRAPNPVPLNCSFFYRDDNSTCNILQKVPDSAQDSITLGIIRRLYPDENQDWVRFWNSKLPIERYYDNTTLIYLNETDGKWGENGSLKNAWGRMIEIYPSAYDEQGKYFYVPNQAMLLINSNLEFVVPNPQNESICAQQYKINGYEYNISTRIGSFETDSQIIPFSSMLAPGQKENMTITFYAKGGYLQNISLWQNDTVCIKANCTITQVCRYNFTKNAQDSLNMSISIPVKRYSDDFSYDNKLAVPKRGFANGIAKLTLPKDFLFYKLTVKGQSFMLTKNELKITKRGEIYPVLQINLISSPSKSGTLHITSINESEDDKNYYADIKYKLYVETPDVRESDCEFLMYTPFGIREIKDACTTERSNAKLTLAITNISAGEAIIRANVTDQLGTPIEGMLVEFSGAISPQIKATDINGVAQIKVEQFESTQTVVAKVMESESVASASDVVFLPGKGTSSDGKLQIWDLVGQAAPIFLIVLIVSSLMIWLRGKRSKAAWALLPMLMIFALCAHSYAQADVGSQTDVQATLDACKNYDFDNAVRHLGECSESFRMATEFNAMRRTASILVASIAPLIVANPDITPYRSAYVNMVLISLALFRVAWAFNSLYLILNIFNPQKRSEALRQYVWLIVFVIFVYASFSIVQDTISAVNSVSTWIAGTDAASTLSQATLSTEFVVENYEMLKLVLPFLNMSYLILLARYITVIGMILFFPFSLLLFFTSATKGFGKATLTVTFASLGLGVLNAILLLIYNILLRTADPTLTGTFASTFFSASFIIFFGFVNLLVLCIAFLSGIVFIGGGSNGTKT
ncbi:MAG: Ig-like domain-containing protein [Candidatus Micrarchaeia archaeon]